MTVSPAWIRRIATHIPELGETPWFSNTPPFPKSHLSTALGARFGVPNVSLEFQEEQWLEPEELQKGLGKNCLILPVTLTPLGTLYWITSREDIRKLTTSLLKPEGKSRPLTSDILQEGFYRYLLLETLDILQTIAPLQTLTLQISEEEGPFEKSFCIDVELEVQGKTSWGRLAIPASLQQAWIDHFKNAPPSYTPTETTRNTPLTLHLNVGSIDLSREEWEEVKKGDLVLLDRPLSPHGLGLLTLDSTPLFKAKIERDQIKLLEEASPHESKPTEESIHLELTQLNITLDALLHLAPGKTIALPIDPKQPLSLTLQGEILGKGEAVHLGEQWALRIL